ncbi:cytochrome P450 [Delitschia confertaspora ATCC 74209]|uniref:Cytochrome P450 n=1 Tax=Delitschia confertaspora ATCC 74209 TaxID=1513339 RepID=A0A9P4JRG8_9PLEO|nr:cytochrome P450 [Delitschia confertaspora ATCC 74209]
MESLALFFKPFFLGVSLLSPHIIVICIVSIILLYHIFSPLSAVPGPLLARYSSLWLVHHSRKGDMHQKMLSLHKKHGKLVRTGPNEVSTSDPVAIKMIYASGSKFRKSDWYSVWQGHRKFDLFAERNEDIHRTQRRLVSRAYSMESMKQLEVGVDDAVKVFLGEMAKREGEKIDMGLWAQLFAFDVIGAVTFSKRFGFMDAGKDDGSFHQIDNALISASWIGQMPWLYWLHDYLSPVIGNWLGVTARHGSLRSFAVKETESRKSRGSDHKDMLEKLLDIHHSKPAEYDWNGVLSMATSNIFAGSDTTAISISAVLYHLCKFPECKAKLMDEILDRANAGQITDSILLVDAMKMPYLQACMHEVLRLHPAVGMALPRVVPVEGIHIDGKFIPGGTVIGTNPWVIHRDTNIFGEDAETFRPERWLEGDRGHMDRFFIAFGAGARVCIGKNLSWMEMSKLIPLVLLNFDIELEDPAGEPKQNCWWFVKQEGLYMRVKRREPTPTN